MANYLVFLTDCQFSRIEADGFTFYGTQKELWFKRNNNCVAFFNTDAILGFKEMEKPNEAPEFEFPNK